MQPDEHTGQTIIWLTLACMLAILLTGAACARSDQPMGWGYDGPGAREHWASLSESRVIFLI